MSPDPSKASPSDPRLQRRRPSDEELDKASEITADDLDAATEAFNRYAPADARGLVDSEPLDGE